MRFELDSLTLVSIVNIPNEPAPAVDQPVGSNVIYDVRPKSDEPPLQFDPDNPPWGLLAGMLTWAGSVALLFAMSFLLLIPYAMMNFKGNSADGQALAEFLMTDKTAILLQILSAIPAHLLTLGVAWAVVTRFGKRPFWQALGWTWGRKVGFWTSAGLAIILYLVGIGLILLFGQRKTQLDLIVESSRAASYVIAFLAVFTAPIAEEVVYRGILYSSLQKKIGVKGAIIGVMVLFTLVHVPQYWGNVGVIAAVGLLSLSLTLVRAYTGRLLPCFIIHLIFNGIQSVLIVLEPYLRPFITDPEPKVPAAIFSSVFDTLIR